MNSLRVCCATFLLLSAGACDDSADRPTTRTASSPLGASSGDAEGALPEKSSKNQAFFEALEVLVEAHPELAAAIASSKPGTSDGPMKSTAALPSTDAGLCREEAPRPPAVDEGDAEYVPTSFSSDVPLRERLAHMNSSNLPSPTSKDPSLSGNPDVPSSAPAGVMFGAFTYRRGK
jgi:hypothetical protein